MSARQAESVTVSGVTIELSNTGKVLFPDAPEITKGDLVGYYRDMAGRIAPLSARPAAGDGALPGRDPRPAHLPEEHPRPTSPRG